jgi:carbon monoxide dehydrogenase subunit G
VTGAAVGGSGGAKYALVLAVVLIGAAPARSDPGSGRAEAAVDAVAAEAAGGPQAVVSRDAEGLVIEGRCEVAASRADVWGVLTDYDGIDDFVSSMRESRISSQGAGYVLVDQVAVGGLFLFRKRLHVTLRVVEEPNQRIAFEDILHRDFVHYRGEWRIAERDGHTEILYRVGAQPRFSVPDFVARGMFRRTVRELLTEVTAEITRRAELARRGAPLNALPAPGAPGRVAGALAAGR